MTQDMDFQMAGEPVNPTYNAGFIVLSYVVSLAGCVTCVELLHRRTSRIGLYNWYLLTAAAVSMGGIGIWCMHFIGNRAIDLHIGPLERPISYSSEFTAISFFLPIGVLFCAFYFIGISERAHIAYIFLTGTLTGSAVCGMHYLGQLGIDNYRCSYEVRFVVGAAIIAVSASITALSVFFRLRESWSNNWWKRVGISSILAVAVSGMHWTATVGTIYHVVTGEFKPSSQLTPSQVVIVCSTLSCTSCVFLVALAFIANRKKHQTAHRVRQLVLASAFYDSSGRIMVTHEGHLPTQKITNNYIERSFADDEFSRIHPAFLWAFRASRDWPSLKSLVKGMKNHLMSNEVTKRYCPGNGRALDDGAELDMDFEFVFKELFCVAAQDLADHFHQPLEKLGFLYDDVLVTGTYTSSGSLLDLLKRRPRKKDVDPEAHIVSEMIGKGQFIFTVRELGKQEAAAFAGNGFRFADVSQVSLTLARSMQVPPEHMLKRLSNMKEYATREYMMEPGVHVAYFSLYPSLHRGFEVLAYKKTPNILPHVPLPMDYVSQWHLDILSRMNDWTLSACLRWLKVHGGYTDPAAKTFCRNMYTAITRLSELMDEGAFTQSKFSSQRIMVPCRSDPDSEALSKCTIFAFRIVNSLQARVSSSHLCLTPLRLFNAKQQVYTGVADRLTFRRVLLEEFSHCSEVPTSKVVSSSSSVVGSVGSSTPSGSHTGSNRWAKKKTDVSSTTTAASEGEKPLIKSTSNSDYGGIVVSSQVTVDIQYNRPIPYTNAFEMRDLGNTVEARYGSIGCETFVDELCALCRDTSDAKSTSSY